MRRLAARAAGDLGRRVAAVAGEHRPAVVVQVEDRHRGQQVHVGVVVRVDGADVAPVALLPIVLPGHDVGAEVVHVGHTGRGERRDDVTADVRGRPVLAGRRDDVDERLGVEHVVPHAGQAAGAVARHGGRRGRLLVEGDDLALGVALDDAERLGLLVAHGDGGNGDARTAVQVVVHHLARVHPVDVVGAEHAHDVGVLVGDQVEVLVDRVGRAGEPVGAAAHLRRHRRHVVAEQAGEPPCLGDVAVQAVAHVLGEHHDLQVPRAGEVGQGEVDDPVAAAERDRGFGAVLRERQHPLAFPAGEHHHEHFGIGHSRNVPLMPRRVGP